MSITNVNALSPARLLVNPMLCWFLLAPNCHVTSLAANKTTELQDELEPTEPQNTDDKSFPQLISKTCPSIVSYGQMVACTCRLSTSRPTKDKVIWTVKDASYVPQVWETKTTATIHLHLRVGESRRFACSVVHHTPEGPFIQEETHIIYTVRHGYSRIYLDSQSNATTIFAIMCSALVGLVLFSVTLFYHGCKVLRSRRTKVEAVKAAYRRRAQRILDNDLKASRFMKMKDPPPQENHGIEDVEGEDPILKNGP